MKILFMIEYSHPGVLGGDATFGRILKKMFPKDIYFLANKFHKKIFFEVQDVKEIYSTNIIFRIINKILFQYLRIFLGKKAVTKINPDICILNMPNTIYKLNSLNVKKILVQHANYDKYMELFYKNNTRLINKTKNELDYFVFLSSKDRDCFVEKLDFPIEKTEIIPHACEIPLLTTAKERNKILIMVARIDNKCKRFDLVINAMKNLSDFKLEIYGEGPDKKELEKLIKVKGLSNVNLNSGTNKIKEVLDKAGIFILNSDFEGYPMSVIEAMRRGLPLIVRKTFESSREIIKDNGILLNKEWDENNFIEAIKEIYDNYSFYSSNSLKKGKEYDFDSIKQKWESLFEKTMVK